MKTRSGSMLIEMALTMTAGSGLMLLAIGLVHQSMNLSTRLRQQVELDRNASRLGRQFMQDVHLAKSVSSDDGSSLRLNADDNSLITYKFQSQRLTREQAVHSEAQPKQPAYESTQLDERSAVSFKITADPPRVELLVMRASELVGEPDKTELQVVASVGKWLRLARTTQEQP